MDKASELAKETTSNFIVLARKQTSGRGREGRQWFSAKDKGLYLTYTFFPDVFKHSLDGLTQVVSLAVIKTLDKLTIKSYLKFPNDVVILEPNAEKMRKISGVLVDIKSSGSRVREVHVGIGLNVKKQEFEDNVPGISAEEVLNRAVSLEEVFDLLIPELRSTVLEFFEKGFTNFEKEVSELNIENVRSR